MEENKTNLEKNKTQNKKDKVNEKNKLSEKKDNTNGELKPMGMQEVKKAPKKVSNEEVDIDKLKETLKEEIKKELEEEKENSRKEKINDAKEKINEKVLEVKKDFDSKKEEVKKEIDEKEKEIKESTEEKKEEFKNKTDDYAKKFEEKAYDTAKKIMDTKEETDSFDKEDISLNKGMALLSYLGPLALIPFLIEKKSKFCSYHSKQGVNLFIIEILFGLVSYFLTSNIKIPRGCTFIDNVTYECGSFTPWFVTLPISLCELIIGLISLVGIIYVCQGRAKELPLVGKIKLIK